MRRACAFPHFRVGKARGGTRRSGTPTPATVAGQTLPVLVAHLAQYRPGLEAVGVAFRLGRRADSVAAWWVKGPYFVGPTRGWDLSESSLSEPRKKQVTLKDRPASTRPGLVEERPSFPWPRLALEARCGSLAVRMLCAGLRG